MPEIIFNFEEINRSMRGDDWWKHENAQQCEPQQPDRDDEAEMQAPKKGPCKLPTLPAPSVHQAAAQRERPPDQLYSGGLQAPNGAYLQNAFDAIYAIDNQLAQERRAVEQKIERMVKGGSYQQIVNALWQRFYEMTEPLVRERDNILAIISKMPMPMLTEMPMPVPMLNVSDERAFNNIQDAAKGLVGGLTRKL